MAGWQRAALVVVLVLAAGAGQWQDSAAAAGETADLLVEGKWVPTPVTTVVDLRDFRPAAEVELSRYGGWKARRIEATGFFRTQRADGRWWLVDPEGYPFLSVGLCSVDRKGVESTPVVADRVFGGRENWASVTATLLRTLGFNSLGCWSDAEPFRALAQPMPYFPRWNFMSTYKNQRDPRDGPRGYPNQCMPLFDAAFKSFCLRHAEQLAATKDDPFLVGHFSDNELPFRPDLLKLYLQLPDTDSGHQAARRWLTQFRQEHKIPTEAEVSETEQAGFLEHAAHEYYSIVNQAIKTYDPNHLYVGSRIHGRTIVEPVFRGAQDVDVVSINYYHRWSPETERLAHWVEWSSRPFLDSEWYAMELPDPKLEVQGAGFRVRTQRDRGLFYQNMVLGLLGEPGCVCWHWFKYGGDSDTRSVGFVDRQYQPHTEMTKVMQAVNRQVYPLADFLSRKGQE